MDDIHRTKVREEEMKQRKKTAKHATGGGGSKSK
jgi:hypothetical protein